MSAKKLSGSTLKIIANIFMIIDHMAIVCILNKNLFSDLLYGHRWFVIYEILTQIGGMAFPIFAFLLVEGFYNTKNVWKYFGRLLCFAVLTEVIYDVALFGNFLYSSRQNIFFTLALGLLVMILVEKIPDKLFFIRFLVLAAVIYLSVILNFDHSFKGIMMIYAFYYFRRNELERAIAVTAIGILDGIAPLSLIFIHFYNGQRGLKIKWLFYLIYPLHLLLLCFI